MAAIPGRLGRLEVSADGGATYVNYGGIVDINPNFNIDELETTDHDSAGHRSYIPNHDDLTMDVSGRWLEGDPGQDLVLNSGTNKTLLNFKFTLQTQTGRKLISGQCFPTKMSPAAPLDDTASFDVTLRCSNALIGTQP